MTYKVIGWLDPGQTTGAAVWVSEEARTALGRLGVPVPEEFSVKQIENCDVQEGLHKLYGVLGMWSEYAIPHRGKDVLVGMESFDFRLAERYRTKIDYTAPQVIGSVRGWQLSRQNVDVIQKTASLGKGFWTDDKLRRVGLYKPSLRHGMDALRHLLRHLTFDPSCYSVSQKLLRKIGVPAGQ